MRPEAHFKVVGNAYITLGRDRKALEKIDIFHDCPPAPRLRATPFALKTELRLARRQTVAGHP